MVPRSPMNYPRPLVGIRDTAFFCSGIAVGALEVPPGGPATPSP